MNTKDQDRRTLRAEVERRRDRTLLRAAPSWRTRARRRAVVALAAVLVVAAVAAVHVQLWSPVLLVAVVGFAVLAAVLRVLTRGVADSPLHQLDERDRAMRDRVWRQAYWVVGIPLAALVLYVAGTPNAPGFGPRTVGMLMVLAWVMVFAPTFVLAWVLPDDDPEDVA